MKTILVAHSCEKVPIDYLIASRRRSDRAGGQPLNLLRDAPLNAQ